MIPGKVKEQREVYLKHYNNLQFVLIRSKPDAGYKTDGEERTIIYVGGDKYWPGIVVGIQLLRCLGCRLPIEVWHRTCEKVYEDDLKGLDVKLINASEVASKHWGVHLDTVQNGGWIAKLVALTFTRAKKVLYLDADAYCVNNPDKLFELLNENSFVYWRDLNSQNNSIRWKNIYPEGSKIGVPCVQGGQLLIDREIAWKVIQVAAYLCKNSTYYFKHMFGDQDAWRVALAALKYDNYKMLGKADWQSVAFVCKYNGTDYIVHRCQSKLFEPKYIPKDRVKYSNPHYHLPLETEVFNLLAGVINKREQESKKVFTEIYSRRLWGGNFLSGSGSTVKEAMPYVRFVNDLIRSKGYDSVVDAGCGDGLVGSLIEVKNYIGLDCCEELLKNNRKKFPKLSYFPLDIHTDYGIINNGDVLLCKDVLHHWPNEWVIKWLSALIESKKWKTIVLCVDRYQRQDFQDCYLGGYRPLNWTMYPLNTFPLKLEMEFLHKAILTIDL